MSSATTEMRDFVRSALERGQTREAIEQALLGAGWPPAQVRTALAAFANSDFPVPVPRPQSHVSARDTFIYLTLFAMLYLAAYHFGKLLFNLIEIWVPDATESTYVAGRHERNIRWAIAALIVATPLFLWLTHKVNREMRENPVRRLSAVRQWLTYLTLFVGAVTIVGDLIWLIYSYLNGELTLRFGLKLVVVAAITGGIFGYYLTDLRERRSEG